MSTDTDRVMFNNQTIRLIAFAAFALVSAAASAQNVVYLTASKDEHPWGSETVEKDFDVVFGEKAWTHGTFDDGEGAYLNSEKTSLLVIEGGDWMAEGMAKYLQSHGDEIGKFVESGGSIIINAAPNVGTTIDLGKDLQIGYPSYSWGAKMADPESELFHGKFGEVKDLSSTYAAHAEVKWSDELGFKSVLYGDDGQTILAGGSFGKGHAYIGGLTIPYSEAYSENAESWTAFNRNLLYSAANFRNGAAPVPEPASMAVLGLGALGMLRRRKKA
jgi:hypothetical protein